MGVKSITITMQRDHAFPRRRYAVLPVEFQLTGELDPGQDPQDLIEELRQIAIDRWELEDAEAALRESESSESPVPGSLNSAEALKRAFVQQLSSQKTLGHGTPTFRGKPLSQLTDSEVEEAKRALETQLTGQYQPR